MGSTLSCSEIPFRLMGNLSQVGESFHFEKALVLPVRISNKAANVAAEAYSP